MKLVRVAREKNTSIATVAYPSRTIAQLNRRPPHRQELLAAPGSARTAFLPNELSQRALNFIAQGLDSGIRVSMGPTQRLLHNFVDYPQG